MKNIGLILVILLNISILSVSIAQIPNVQLKDINGKTFSTEDILKLGKPVVISFWATWCKPCVKELSAIGENYEAWAAETGVRIFAVSIDDSRSSSRVAPFVNGKAWEFDVLLDPNGDFKRAMNVVNVPHTFLIDKNGKIVDQHTSYNDGDELELYKKIKELAGK